MNNFERTVCSYSIKNDRKIKTICAPLISLLNIPVFSYSRISPDGTILSTSSHLEQYEFYHAEKMYLTNPYIVHPDLVRPGCVLLESTASKEYINTIEKSKNRFNFSNPFLILEKNGADLELFYFARTENVENGFLSYINNLEALKSFGRYFAREASPFLQKMKGEGCNVKDLKGDKFLYRNSQLPLANDDLKLSSFFKAISPLSPQEQRCLDLFRRGNSAQSTAAVMGISNRTVEHYFESIKNKYNCHSKWDLLNIQ